VRRETQVLGARLGRQHRFDLRQRQVQVDVVDDDLDLARFDLGEVEDVGDLGQERVGRGADGLHHLALRAGQGRIAEQVAHADDAVERRPHLVADISEEAALGLARLFGLSLGLVQFLEQRRDIGRQHDERREQAVGQRRLALPVVVALDHEQETERAHDRAERQIAQAVAEAHAEGDEQVDPVPHRGRAAAREHEVGQRRQVEAERQEAPHHRDMRLIEQVEEEQERGQQEGARYLDQMNQVRLGLADVGDERRHEDD
jgi:hypothetical protein